MLLMAGAPPQPSSRAPPHHPCSNSNCISAPGGSLIPCCLSLGPVSGCALTLRASLSSSCIGCAGRLHMGACMYLYVFQLSVAGA